MMSDAPTDSDGPILDTHRLRIAADTGLSALEFDLQVLAGELHLLYLRDRRTATTVADALLGIGSAGGTVRYLGQAWHDLDHDASLRLRRGIGRVRGDGNWNETRPVIDSVLLPARHNGVVEDRVLREQAGKLAQRFGLPGLPTELPARCLVSDLERAACVRAFLGRPVLVILEHPMQFEDSAMLAPLIEAIQQVRRRGGAVLWFTEHRQLAADRGIPADRRHHVVGSQLHPLGGRP
ncbi:MAG: hypothetical protein H6953_09420 [Chromatiaceae bacterium]|nr:hypothetical protein [Gammaproteobacteria bacterium]MCP5305656.1 hypothetical protein [Chromatiaceae bacterium]MCP5312513.1 hypothetical protein [Chromatiaceae bacterium]